MDWDLLFWSDTSVSFEVYELNSGSSGGTGRAVRQVVIDSSGNVIEAENPTDAEIVIPADYPGAAGLKRDGLSVRLDAGDVQLLQRHLGGNGMCECGRQHYPGRKRTGTIQAGSRIVADFPSNINLKVV